MKINKTLAAGIAATLAVTSLASVAGARSRTWDMERTYGQITYKPYVTGVTAIDPGDYFDFKSAEDKVARSFALANAAEAGVDTNFDGTVNDLDFDYYIPFIVESDHEDLDALVDKLTVVISGKRIASNGATTENVTQSVVLTPVKSATTDDANVVANYILPIYNGGSPADGSFIPERFVQIDKIDFKVAAKGEYVAKGLGQGEFELIQKNATKGDSWHPAIVKDAEGDLDVLYDGEIEQPWDAHAAKVRIRLADAYNDADGNGYDDAVLAYPVKDATATYKYDAAGNHLFEVEGDAGKKVADLADGDGETPTEEKLDGGYLLSKIKSLMASGCSIALDANGGAFTTVDEPAWMPRTEDPNDGNEIISRNEVWLLSDTADYDSDSGIYDFERITDDQTYTVEDYNRGTKPHGFAGMASQFADFFNSPADPRKEAKVIFVFDAYTPAANNNTWKNGGIPSTEVGLRNFLEKQDVKDFALYVNYEATTGSLFATATLDAASGSVIFDVSDILKALGGQTIGTVHDLYYALASHIDYDGKLGLWVKEVKYEYSDAAADTAADKEAEKPAEKPAEEKPAEKPAEDDKEITIGGDEKETEVPADTKPADASNNGSAVVDTGANKADENPHTGVALAVIPAIVAGAAVVASKKRK